MYCPICLKNNLDNKIICITSTCYVCDNVDCLLCLSAEQFNSLTQETCENEITKDKVLATDVSSYNNTNDVLITSTFCDDSDGIIVIKSNNDDQTENYSNDHNLQNSQNSFDNVQSTENTMIDCHFTVDLDAETCEQPIIDAQNQLLANDKLKISMDKYYNVCEINNHDQPSVTKLAKPSRKHLKRVTSAENKMCPPKKRKTVCNTISIPVKSNLTIELSTFNQSPNIFNWLKLPINIKTESKIISAIFLYMELFSIDNSPINIEKVKLQYVICNTFANRFHLDFIKPLCYSFQSCLFDMIQMISSSQKEQIGSNIINIFQKYFNKSDPSGANKCDFLITIRCKNCKTNSSTTNSDYFLSLPYVKSYFRMTKKKIIYSICCQKCENKAEMEIKFVKLPKFLIIHCPHGSKCQATRFLTEINVDKKDYSLVSVIECGSGRLSSNLEHKLNYEQFTNAMKSYNGSNKSFHTHMRYKSGWYTMSETGPYMCQPSPTLNVKEALNIRLLIYGQLPDNSQDMQKSTFDNFLRSYRENYNLDLNLFSRPTKDWTIKNQESKIINPAEYEPKDSTISNILNQNMSIEIVPLDLDQPPCNRETDSFPAVSPYLSSLNVCTDSLTNNLNIFRPSQKKAVSIHSQSTASRFDVDTESEKGLSSGFDSGLSCDVSSLVRNTCSKNQPLLQHNSQASNPYHMSSSGVSSCSSLFDHGPLSSRSHRKVPSINSHTTSSQLSNPTSEPPVNGLDILTRKRHCTIDDLIQRKRLKTMPQF